MIVDQAEKLRLLVRNTQKTARVLAVTSGKGGVGKTNIAANLAICLAASGKKVILVDADLGLANLDIIFNVRARYSLAHVISGRRHIDQIIQEVPGGVRLICGASGLTDLAELNEFQRQRLVQELAALERQADFIIIDTGAGISADVLGFCQAADRCLVVTTPEPTSITDAYAMIKQLSRGHTGVKLSVLVNMADSRIEAKKVYQRVTSTAKKFLNTTVSDAGYILRDEHLCQAVSQCEPVVLAFPRSQVSYCFLALAGKMSRGTEKNTQENRFFRKVVNWFF